MKKLTLLIVLIAAASIAYLAWRSSGNRSNGTSTGLPPLRGDPSSLSDAGKAKLRDIESRIPALREANTKQRLEAGYYIAEDLRKIGYYRSAAEWYLSTRSWYMQLAPDERKTKKLWKPDAVPRDCTWSASTCFFFAGDRKEALRTIYEFVRQCPNDPMTPDLRRFYVLIRDDPQKYAEAASILRANPRYLAH